MKSAIRNPKSEIGFTILEMLVAIAATVIMVLFLNQIFAHMSAAVSMGNATSNVIENNRVFSKQVGDDAEEMVSAQDEGFIVLFQHEVPSNPLYAIHPNRRSDQIAWIRTRGALQPICPQNANEFENGTSGAANVRVWYGHVVPSNTAPVPGDEVEGIPSLRRVLGRQAMFLGAPGGGIYLNHLTANWNTVGYGGVPWYEGSSDVLDQDLNGITTAAAFPVPYAYHFAFPDSRLWCLNLPPNTSAYSDQEIAQMHPFMMANVSEIQVDFAGDYQLLSVGEPPLGTDVDSAANIKWYSAYYNEPDAPAGLGYYDGTPHKPAESTTFRPPPFVAMTTPNGFVAPGTALPNPVYDTTSYAPPNAMAAFVWRPGVQSAPNWPHMFRFRYRLHDRDGRLTDRDGGQGKLFERIIKVPPLP